MEGKGVGLVVDGGAGPVGGFCEFGQFGPGMLDLRVFAQDGFWVDANGRGHRLEQMGDSYRSAVVEFLLDRAGEFHAAVLLLDVVVALPSGPDVASAALAALADGVHGSRDCFGWLESTPLMQRLRELSPAAPTLGDMLSSVLR